jgi:hypothetical protein
MMRDLPAILGLQPHSVEVPYDEVDDDDPEGVLRTLVRFRRAFPDQDGVPAANLVWGYTWTERPTLLDLSIPPSERVDLREKATTLVQLYCRSGKKRVFGTEHHSFPPPLAAAILVEESDRSG